MRTLSRRKAKQRSKPWITKGIRTSIKIKNKLYLSGNDASKKKYFCEYFQANINNMKKTWIGINNILNRKIKKSISISTLKDFKNNNEVSGDPTRIPNIRNEHFATVGQKLANQLPSTSKCFTDFLGKCKSSVSSFFFQPITPAEIRLQILSIPNTSHTASTLLCMLIDSPMSRDFAMCFRSSSVL